MKCILSLAFVAFLMQVHLIGETVGSEIEAGELIKLARNHRVSCRQGTATYAIKFKSFMAEEVAKEDSETIKISWNGNRIIRESLGRQTEESGARMAIIRDGQLLEYSRFTKRALISDRTREYGASFFDPRSLGVTTRTVVSEPLRSQLFPDDAGMAMGRGDELVGGIACSKIQWVRNGSTSEILIWIEKSAPYRIIRYEASGMRKTNTYKESISIPETCTIERVAADGKLMYRNLYRLIDFTPKVSSSIAFSLSDFKMPIGTPVVDLSINEVVGYWNGTEPVASYFDAVHSSGLLDSEIMPRQQRIRPSIYVVSGLAIAAIFISVYRWRSRRRDVGE